MNLFEISEEIRNLERHIEENGGELSAEIEKLFNDALDKRDVKIDNYVALIKEFEGRAEIRKAEMERLQNLCTNRFEQRKKLER